MLINRLFPFEGICFENDPPGGGGGGDAGDPPDADAGGKQGGDEEKKFSQADLDRAAGERAKRAKKTALSELLQELGLEKIDDLKGIVTGHKQAKDAEQSELQKAQQKEQAAERKSQDLEAQLKRERLDRVIERTARELEFADVSDATALVDRALTETGEDGAISGVKEALEKLLEAKPHLKRQGQQQQEPPPASGSVPPSPAGDKTPKKVTDEEKRKKATPVRNYW